MTNGWEPGELDRLVTPQDFEALSDAAQNLSNTMGISMVEAVRTLRAALHSMREMPPITRQFVVRPEERDYLEEFRTRMPDTPAPISEDQVAEVARRLVDRNRTSRITDINGRPIDLAVSGRVIGGPGSRPEQTFQNGESFTISSSWNQPAINMLSREGTCAQCGAVMEYERSTKKFCSTACRVAAYKQRIREGVNVTGNNPAAELLNVNDIAGYYNGEPIVTLREVAALMTANFHHNREVMEQWSAVGLINNLFLHRGSMSFDGETFTWTASRNPTMPVLPSGATSPNTPEQVVLQHGVQSGSVATTPRRGRPPRTSERSSHNTDVAPAE